MIREINITRNDCRKFYQFVKSKKIAHTELPMTLLYKNQVYTDDLRIQQFCNHFESCFIKSTVALPAVYNDFIELAHDIYRSNYTPRYEQYWNDYINWFTLDEVVNQSTILMRKRTLVRC